MLLPAILVSRLKHNSLNIVQCDMCHSSCEQHSNLWWRVFVLSDMVRRLYSMTIMGAWLPYPFPRPEIKLYSSMLCWYHWNTFRRTVIGNIVVVLVLNCVNTCTGFELLTDICVLVCDLHTKMTCCLLQSQLVRHNSLNLTHHSSFELVIFQFSKSFQF